MQLYNRAKTFIRAHRTVTIIGIVIAIALLWWAHNRLTNTTGVTRYVLGTVSSSTVIASVSASGQVSANNQLDIKPKVSGTIVYLPVVAGQKVAEGQLIAQIDDTDAQKAVRDAQANLQSGQISLQKIQKPADALTLTQAQNAALNAKTALTTDYTNAINDLSSTFLDIPDIISGLQNIVTGTATNKFLQWNIDFYLNAISTYTTKGSLYRTDAYNGYINAQKSYDASSALYKSTTLSVADPASVEKLLKAAYDTTNALFESAKDTNSFIQLYEDTLKSQNTTPSTVADSQLTTIASYTSKLNSHLSTLLADNNSLTTDKQKIIETQQSLDKTQQGSDVLDIQSAELNVTKAQNALTDAKNALANYYIRAPFAGTLAAVNAKKYDTANNGSALATIITPDQIATLSVNEVDAAKMAVGQKATLTFDAIDGLTIAGTVSSIDTIGAVSQGVVSYNVKVNFSTQDTRVKPGMTANASIITATAVDTLAVPASAVKTQNGASTVQVFQPALADIGTSASVTSTQTPITIPVVIGISDDTNVQIISGLKLGDQIIVKTITGAAAAASAARPAAGFGGGGGGGRGGIRIGG